MPDPKVALPVKAVQRGSKWVVVDAEGAKVSGGGPFTSEDVARRIANNVNAAWSSAKADRKSRGAPEITQEADFDARLHPKDRRGRWARKGPHPSLPLAGTETKLMNPMMPGLSNLRAKVVGYQGDKVKLLHPDGTHSERHIGMLRDPQGKRYSEAVDAVSKGKASVAAGQRRWTHKVTGTLQNRAADVHAINKLIRDAPEGGEVHLDSGVHLKRQSRSGMKAISLHDAAGRHVESYPAGMPMVAAAYAVALHHRNPGKKLSAREKAYLPRSVQEGYDEHAHPRGRTGEWIKKLGGGRYFFSHHAGPQHTGENLAITHKGEATSINKVVPLTSGKIEVFHEPMSGGDERLDELTPAQWERWKKGTFKGTKVVPVQEAFFGQDVNIPFDPKLHPRDRLGEFARVLARVHAGGHGSASPIAGSSIRVTNHLGRLRVQHPGGSVHVKNPEAAAGVALFYHDEHHGSELVKGDRLARIGELRQAERTAAREGDMAAWDVLGKAQRHVRLTTGPGAVGPKRARGKGVPGRLIAPVAGAASGEAGKPSPQAGLTGGHTTRELHDIFGTDRVSSRDLEDHIADLRDELDHLADSESAESRRSYYEVQHQIGRAEATLNLTRRAEANRRHVEQGQARAAHNARLHVGGA